MNRQILQPQRITGVRPANARTAPASWRGWPAGRRPARRRRRAPPRRPPLASRRRAGRTPGRPVPSRAAHLRPVAAPIPADCAESRIAAASPTRCEPSATVTTPPMIAGSSRNCLCPDIVTRTHDGLRTRHFVHQVRSRLPSRGTRVSGNAERDLPAALRASTPPSPVSASLAHARGTSSTTVLASAPKSRNHRRPWFRA